MCRLTIGLSIKNLCPSLVDDAVLDTTFCEPCCHHQSSWTGTNDLVQLSVYLNILCSKLLATYQHIGVAMLGHSGGRHFADAVSLESLSG